MSTTGAAAQSAQSTQSTQDHWEERYNDPARTAHAEDRIWSGKPNELLVREVASLTPGSALDLGCGEGGDAVWLAQQGWQVTGVDVSPTALRRAALGVEQNGVADRVVLQHLDLAAGFPGGTYDLVCAQYFHSMVAGAEERTTTFRRAAGAVAPGGVLLVVGHAGWPTWAGDDHPDVALPTTTQVLVSLALDSTGWSVEVEDVVERTTPPPTASQASAGTTCCACVEVSEPEPRGARGGHSLPRVFGARAARHRTHRRSHPAAVRTGVPASSAPLLRACNPKRVTVVPSRVSDPDAGSYSRDRTQARVLLPDPLGPQTPTASPAATSSTTVVQYEGRAAVAGAQAARLDATRVGILPVAVGPVRVAPAVACFGVGDERSVAGRP